MKIKLEVKNPEGFDLETGKDLTRLTFKSGTNIIVDAPSKFPKVC